MNNLATAALIAVLGGFAGIAGAQETTAPVAVTQDGGFGDITGGQLGVAAAGIAAAVLAIELAEDDDDNGGSGTTTTNVVND